MTLLERFREWRDYFMLIEARTRCELEGHLDGETIQFKGQLCVACPRCGKDLE